MSSSTRASRRAASAMPRPSRGSCSPSCSDSLFATSATATAMQKTRKIPREGKATGVGGSLSLHLFLTALSFAMILPFAWMVLTSLKTLREVAEPDWIPRTLQWGNYLEVFHVIPFLRFMGNSLVVAGWVTLLQVITSAMAAYSFARLDWPGRDRVFFLYLGTMMLPGLVMLIPNFENMVKAGLVDTYLGRVLPASFSAFGTFLLRQFMLGIPRSLDEAAEMDGA